MHAAVLEGAGDVDTLARRAGLRVSQAASALVELELQHLVALEDGIYRALGRAEGGVRH
jgi:predicted Rossmann fold nucleotide-binding protein DprA/Smf involved in DNA uptake